MANPFVFNIVYYFINIVGGFLLCSGLLSHVPKLLILFKSMVLDLRRNAVYCLVNYEGFALGLLGLSPGVGIAYTRGKRRESRGISKRPAKGRHGNKLR